MRFPELADVITAPASYLAAGWLLGVSVTWMFIGAAVVILLSSLVVVTARAVESTGTLDTPPTAEST